MEQFDLYDKERQKTAYTMNRGEPVPANLYRTVIHIALFNSEGKMLIQQRQKDKKGWPGLWDFTIGGHVTSGETSTLGAQRELEEELGIKIDFSSLRPAFTMNFKDGFDDYYVVCKELIPDQLQLQTEEVQAVRWADKQEILQMIDSGTFIPYKSSLISMLFEMQNSTGAHRY